MMQVQNQTQQISEEELLIPLSEDELASIAGGFIPDPPSPRPNPLGEARRQLVAQRCRPNPLDIAQFGWKIASTAYSQ